MVGHNLIFFQMERVMRRILAQSVFILICALSSATTKAIEILDFHIKCTKSYIKQGIPEEDFTKKSGQPIECGDHAILSFLDNERVLLQIVKKKSKINNIYGFGGYVLDHTDEKTWMMPVEHMYLPPTGTTANVDSNLGGACMFVGGNDIKKIKHVACIANIIPNPLFRTVYNIEFDVLGLSGAMPQPKTKSKNLFDKISQYTLMKETLPDGKHPVWIYYEVKGKTVIRITIPSLDLCGVMQDSKSDNDILDNNMADSIREGSDDWNMALDIWKTAFNKYMLTGTPTHCK